MYKTLEIPAPIYAALTLSDVYGYSLYKEYWRHLGNSINEIHLIGEGVWANSYDDCTPELLIPEFNHVWNACGCKRPQKLT